MHKGLLGLCQHRSQHHLGFRDWFIHTFVLRLSDTGFKQRVKSEDYGSMYFCRSHKLLTTAEITTGCI